MNASRPKLILFTVKATQASIKEEHMEENIAFSGIKNDGPLEFNIVGDGDHYMDLNHSMLYVEAKVVHADSTDLAADTDVTPVNLTLHSMYKQVDVSLNNKMVTMSTNMYPYKAYLETLLTYGKDAKKSQLTK